MLLTDIYDELESYALALTANIKAKIKHEGLEAGISRWIPSHIQPSDKQLIWLQNDFDECHLGGAIGGGKTAGLLMAALKFFDVPGYRCVIFRRNMEMFKQANGLKDQLLQWTLPLGARWNEKTHTLTSPQGGTIQLAHLYLMKHIQNYIGGGYQAIFFDQLEEIDPDSYRLLFSRRRNLKTLSHIPLRVYSTSNPDPGAMWVYDMFIHEAEEVGESLYEKEHTNDEGLTWKAHFIPARLDDNPGLDKESYLADLARLTPEERDRLLNGDWHSRDQGDVLHMNSPVHSVITYSEFKRFYGITDSAANIIESEDVKDIIPIEFSLNSGFDWGQTPGRHDTCGSWAARPPKHMPLHDSVFVYREKVWNKPSEASFANDIKKLETLEHERMRMYASAFSHEQATVRLTLANEYGLNFSGTVPHRLGGLANIRAYLTVIDSHKPHPFRPELMGRPRLYLLVQDGQGNLMRRDIYDAGKDKETDPVKRANREFYTQSPRDEKGLKRHRAEIAALKWDKDAAGERTIASFDDMFHAMRNYMQKMPRINILDPYRDYQDDSDLTPDLQIRNILEMDDTVSQQKMKLLRSVELTILNQLKGSKHKLPHYKRRIL